MKPYDAATCREIRGQEILIVISKEKNPSEQFGPHMAYSPRIRHRTVGLRVDKNIIRSRGQFKRVLLFRNSSPLRFRNLRKIDIVRKKGGNIYLFTTLVIRKSCRSALSAYDAQCKIIA